MLKQGKAEESNIKYNNVPKLQKSKYKTQTVDKSNDCD